MKVEVVAYEDSDGDVHLWIGTVEQWRDHAEEEQLVLGSLHDHFTMDVESFPRVEFRGTLSGALEFCDG